MKTYRVEKTVRYSKFIKVADEDCPLDTTGVQFTQSDVVSEDVAVTLVYTVGASTELNG